MPAILLTPVGRFFGGKNEGDSVGAELFHAQVICNQRIFSYLQVFVAGCLIISRKTSRHQRWSFIIPPNVNFVVKSKNDRFDGFPCTLNVCISN